MENPDYIEKVKAYYDQEVLPVAETGCRYVGRLPGRFNFKTANGSSATVKFEVLDKAVSHLATGGKITTRWLAENNSRDTRCILMLKALIQQFGMPEPRTAPLPPKVPAWQNPEFIAKVQQHFDKVARPLEHTIFQYTGRKSGKLRFVSHKGAGFLLSFELLDSALSRHRSGKKVGLDWVRMNGGWESAMLVVRAIIEQFADPDPNK